MIPANSALAEGLRDGLRKLGYMEGKNIAIDWRASGSADSDLRAAALELAREKTDLIVVGSTLAGRAALEATTAPIVFVSGDPVAASLAASLARPGGRATGVSLLTTELAGKRLELLRTLAPKADHIVFMMNSANPQGARQLKEAQEAARTLGVHLVSLDVQTAGGIDGVLNRLPRSKTGGVVIAAEILFFVNRAKIAQAVRKAKLPAIFPATEYHDSGVLLSYGPNLTNTGRALAPYVDRILKGANPAELPVEQVSELELVVDLREARLIWIVVPETFLLRAHQVIQ